MGVCQCAKVKWSPSWLGRPAVVFPIYDDKGALVAAQGRYTDGREDPKARTLGRKKRGVFLTGDFWEQVRKGAPVILTEAPIDALSLSACGFPALALCGRSGWPQWLPIKCAFKDPVWPQTDRQEFTSVMKKGWDALTVINPDFKNIPH